MDVLREFLGNLKRQGSAEGQFLGLLHVLIGRQVSKDDGTLVSTGQSWRELSALLKRVRWDPEAVRELGLNPADLPPRDRQRYWYMAISQARVDSEEATQAGDRLATSLHALGYVIGPPPRR